MAERRAQGLRESATAEIGVLTLVGVALALIGPFGTDALGLGLRLAYWIGGMVAGWLVLQAILLVMRPVAIRFGLPFPLEYLLAVPLLASIGVACLAILGGQDEGELLGKGGAVSQMLFVEFAAVGIGIFLLFGALYAFAGWRKARCSTLRQPAQVTAPLNNTKLHERLPPAFGPILALAVEDHYVTVIGEGIGTTRREMLLMNLSEAITEVGAGFGQRTHRSWWVAHGAVVELRRDGRNTVAVLSNGVEAPVSRAHVAAVKATLK